MNLLYNRIHGAANYRLRKFAGGRYAAHCRPVTVVFLLTEHCNARCIHCDIWKNKDAEDVPTLQQLKDCLQDLRQWLGPVQISFTGGEALLQPSTIELVRHASSLGLFVEVLTNGYWSGEAKMQSLAMARPWRVKISMDGEERGHNIVRGRDDFYAKTTASIQTLLRARQEHNLKYSLMLKTVIMAQNLDEVVSVARYAADNKVEVLYQPIEQTYNTAPDLNWYEHCDNWPRDLVKVKAVLRELEDLKKQGLPIVNTYEHLRLMADYFENPAPLQLTVQSHVNPGEFCSAATSFQLQANGDVRTCARKGPIGNIKTASIRTIWKNRPRFWETGCCRQES